jgi:hypothetical protein
MTSKGLGEMFQGDFADMCAGKLPLVAMGGRAEGLACTDPGARTPIDASQFVFPLSPLHNPLPALLFLVTLSFFKIGLNSPEILPRVG